MTARTITPTPLGDPVRNFRFTVQFNHPDPVIDAALDLIGFMNVSGLTRQTEVIPYREGGMNTSPHKLPGQTDHGPVTCTTGFIQTRKGMIDWSKMLHAVQWGSGTLGPNGEFRCDIVVRTLQHPVTNTRVPPAVVAHKLYDCWISNFAFGDLDAGGNSILVQQMVIVHEGFETRVGADADKPWP